MSLKKISVIIPAHNEEKCIEECLKSLEAQSVKPHEVLVMCNGCTDRTVEIVKKYPVTCLVTKKSGLNYARNYAAKKAKGDVLLFMDADVISAPNLIEELERAVEGKEHFYGSVKSVPDDTQFKRYFWVVNTAVRLVGLAANGTVFCSKKDYVQSGGWPEWDTVGFEFIFIKELKRLKGMKFVFLNKTHVIGNTRRFRKEGVVKPTVQWLTVPFRKRDFRCMGYDNRSLR